mgnify:CR=1 FL=1
MCVIIIYTPCGTIRIRTWNLVIFANLVILLCNQTSSPGMAPGQAPPGAQQLAAGERVIFSFMTAKGRGVELSYSKANYALKLRAVLGSNSENREVRRAMLLWCMARLTLALCTG